MKKTIYIAALVAALAPSAALADKISLAALSQYLNQLGSAKSAFTQVNPDNTLSKGTFMIRRPGRMRFEYDAPNPALVVASSGQIAVFDKKSISGPQVFPIAKTPLGLILKKNVDLGASGMVIRHVQEGPSTKVTAQDPKHPQYGNIQLVFTANPIELRQWIVTDQSGNKTTVVLGALDKEAHLPLSLFNQTAIARDLSPF
ncbi:MAG: cell envelope biogenesis protein LolA [Rhodobacteraceae bacterium]|nr:MAG: cell envelope biogenesis protein LolA [Paracoccaceae bacterium]